MGVRVLVGLRVGWVFCDGVWLGWWCWGFGCFRVCLGFSLVWMIVGLGWVWDWYWCLQIFRVVIFVSGLVLGWV